MVAQNTAETDEQIIDLTELIEKGEVPASDPSEQTRAHAAAEAAAEKEELQEHLRDLNDGAAKADAEIDDLLAQMDIKADAQEDPADVALDFSAPSTQTDHHIDPNEQLKMPGMGDVDSLLDSLDIPPQPSDREAETASPETPDQAVDALLNDFNAPSAPAAPAAAASATEVAAEPHVNLNAPDLDELLASVGAAPQSNPTSEIDDLLSAASPAANLAAEAAPAAPQKTFSNDDLDSLLEAAAGQTSGPSPIMTAEPAPQPVAAPQPATVTQPVAAPQPGPSAGMDVDIDSLLAAAANDMQQSFDAGQAATEPEAAPAPVSTTPTDAVTNDDLDSLLAAATADLEAEPSPTPAQSAAPAASAASAAPASATAPTSEPGDMGVDIDSLLAAAANDMQQSFDAGQAATEPEAAPAPVSATPTAAVTNDDLDSLLAAATAELEAEPNPAPAQSAAPAASAAPASPAPATAPTSGPGDMGVDIDSLLAAAANDMQQIDAAEPEAAPVSATPPATVTNDDLDSLLAAAANDLEQTLDAAQPEAPAMPEAVAESADAPQPDIDLDLDSLLAAVDAKAAPEAAAEPQATPEMADPFADALQAVADATPVQPDTAPEIEAAQVYETQPEPVSEPEFEAESVPEPESASEGAAQPELAADTQPEIMELLPEDQAAEAVTADLAEAAEAGADTDAVAEPAADIEAMMAAAAGEALSADGSEEQDIPAESVDDLLAAMSADLSAQPGADILSESAPAADDALPLVEPVAEPADAFVEEPMADFAAQAAPEEDPQHTQPDLHEFETSHAALAAQLQDDTDLTGLESQAVLDTTLATVSAEALEAVMTQANEASSHALDAFAQAFDASSRAADAAEAVGNLAARVELCERALQEAGDRIIALETALETQIAVLHNLTTTALPQQELEGMFMEGHPLYQGLMECISKAVAETLAATPAPASALTQHAAAVDVQAQIDEHLQPVITAARIATARIDSLENRLDALEPRFNDRIEKAAAAAAARILREEIGRLLEE